MTPSSDAYVAFLSARLADDEQHADRQHDQDCDSLPIYGTDFDLGRCTCGVPDSIRGWCHTGRHILRLHTAYTQQAELTRMAVAALDQVVREMARNYRHHPDYPGGAT